MTDQQQRFVSYEGTHKARAVEAEFGVANGKEQIGILFEILSGPQQGKTITGYFFFTDAAIDRTLEGMRYCGWSGDTIADLTGLSDNEVEIEVAVEEYKGKYSNKVKWINRPSRLVMNNKLDGSALAAFAARIRGKAVASKQKAGAQSAAAPRAAAPASYGRAASNGHAEDFDPGPGAEADYDDGALY